MSNRKEVVTVNVTGRKNSKTSRSARRRRNRRRQRKASNNQMVVTAPPRSSLALAKRQQQAFSLSPCANDYLSILCDPFTPRGPACIPDERDGPSYKGSSLVRGTAAVGTEGVGFLLVTSRPAPYDTAKALVTTSAYTGTTLGTSSSTGVSVVNDTQFPYGTATMAGQFSSRTVGCGVRITYTGTELNRGGSYYIHSVPSNTAYPVATTTPVIGAFRDAKIRPCTRRWNGVTYYPRATLDFDYGDSATSGNILGIPSATTNNGDLLIMFNGEPGNTFNFEIVTYWEIIVDDQGAGVQLSLPNTSKSHSDIVGMGQIRGFFEQGQVLEPGPGLLKQAYNWISKVSPDEVSRWVDYLAPVAKGGVKLLAGSSLGPAGQLLLTYPGYD